MKANYPDWVMKHKKKGTYINKVGDKYYLYAAHSERIKGTDKVRRISDGYLGRITEKDGFIPARDKVSGLPVAYEIGLSYAILSITNELYEGLKQSYPKYGEIIYACAILSYIYGSYNKELFEQSYLHIRFPDVPYPTSFTKAQLTGIERGYRMMKERIPKTFGDDLPQIRTYFPNIRLLMINKKYYLSPLSESALTLSQKYKIDWRNPLWQK